MKHYLNRPLDYIHDPTSSYGRLLFPSLKKGVYGNTRWIALFCYPSGIKKVRMTDSIGFHNCRIRGIK